MVLQVIYTKLLFLFKRLSEHVLVGSMEVVNNGLKLIFRHVMWRMTSSPV